jgi:hypothetical protein
LLENIIPGKIPQNESFHSSRIILTTDEDGKFIIKVDTDSFRLDSLILILSSVRDPDFFKDILSNIYHLFEKDDPESFLTFSNLYLDKISKSKPIISPVKLGLKYENRPVS